MSADNSGRMNNTYRFVVCPVVKEGLRSIDPRSAGYLADAHALGLAEVDQILCHDLFFIEGCLSEAEGSALATHLLSDHLTQEANWALLDRTAAPGSFIKPGSSSFLGTGMHLVEVALRPGVTDPVAEQIVRAAHVLGIPGVQRAATGQRFIITGQRIDQDLLRLLSSRLLANPTIQRFAIGEIEPAFPHPAAAIGDVEWLAVRGLDDAGLLALSQARRAALDLPEMQAIQQYFRAEGRELTDVELETIAQTWSEHCGHKTFKARVTLHNKENAVLGQVDNLLKTYLRAATEKINAPWVRSAFVDNAGIIDFDDQYEVSFKVETHNHPSAIEPFGGANTGVGGVIRDVIGVSAKPIAATDVLCFGLPHTSFDYLPAGVLHPRRIRSGVVAGVQDYGNKIGLPTVSGAILYDPGFTANPLVFCGCVGIAPKDSHPREPQPGDRVIVLGGGTGRDGLRGATFSSMTMDAQTGEVSGASVQIGAPIVEKGLIDVILQARDLKLYHAITDCGAGGLSSAVGEMANPAGADVDLKAVRLKYPGLAPWEIWLSEAQERMVLAVPPANLPQLQALCRTYDVELTDIGAFTATGRLVVRYGANVVLDLTNAFLHDGIPQRRLSAVLPETAVEALSPAPVAQALIESAPGEYARLLCGLLSHPNIASKAPVIRIYDHEVQGGTLIKPLTGALNDGPSDAVVLKPTGATGTTAIVLSAGINPEYGKRDVYNMTLSVVDEAIRNAVAVGANPDRIALLDNFCWANPKDPQVMGELVESARGCYDAACYYGTPFISGKDSLNNEYLGKDNQRHAIPPTLLISAIGVIPDLNRTVTMDLKQPGNLLYLLGEPRPALGGSHLSLVTGIPSTDNVPGLPGIPELPGISGMPGSSRIPASSAVSGNPIRTRELYRALYAAIQSGLVSACHDLSEGGLAVAAAEMCIGGRLGLDLDFSQIFDPTRALFGETNGCLLAEVSPEHAAQFETQMSGLPIQKLGRVTSDRANADMTSGRETTTSGRENATSGREATFVIRYGGQVLIDLPVEDLVAAFQVAN